MRTGRCELAVPLSFVSVGVVTLRSTTQEASATSSTIARGAGRIRIYRPETGEGLQDKTWSGSRLRSSVCCYLPYLCNAYTTLCGRPSRSVHRNVAFHFVGDSRAQVKWFVAPR